MTSSSSGRMLRLPSVQAEVGLSRSEIYRRIGAGTFPKPLKLGARAVAWTAASIDQWRQSLINQGGA